MDKTAYRGPEFHMTLLNEQGDALQVRRGARVDPGRECGCYQDYDLPIPDLNSVLLTTA
jgi:hypothetical protein